MLDSLKSLLIGLLVSVILLEIACAIFIRTGYIPARIPTYSMSESGALYWADIDEHVGVWHIPESTFQHEKSCFSVTYTSNSYGSQDIERKRSSTKARMIALGDSFVEGYGVPQAKRFTNLLEQTTAMPHLNFGTSGSFGPTQQYLLYQHLASGFDHEAICIGLLPDNDFDDDGRRDTKRYHPYWEAKDSTYELKYSLDSPNQSQLHPDNYKFDYWETFWRNYTHIKNIAEYVNAIWEYKKVQAHVAEEDYVDAHSRYVRFSQGEFDRLVYSYEQIHHAAGDKPIFIIVIPRIYDIEYYLKNKNSPLGEKLQTWAEANPTIEIIDLLPLFVTYLQTHEMSPLELFHTCDGHWNETGHAIASELLSKHIPYDSLQAKTVIRDLQ